MGKSRKESKYTKMVLEIESHQTEKYQQSKATDSKALRIPIGSGEERIEKATQPRVELGGCV